MLRLCLSRADGFGAWCLFWVPCAVLVWVPRTEPGMITTSVAPEQEKDDEAYAWRQAKREGLLGVRPTPKQRKRITVVRLLTRPPCKTCWRRKRGSAKARCDQRIQ